MIKDRLTKITDMQNYIKINDLSYSSIKNNYNFNNYSLLIVLLTYTKSQYKLYLRYQPKYEVKNTLYLMDHILYSSLF